MYVPRLYNNHLRIIPYIETEKGYTLYLIQEIVLIKTLHEITIKLRCLMPVLNESKQVVFKQYMSYDYLVTTQERQFHKLIICTVHLFATLA